MTDTDKDYEIRRRMIIANSEEEYREKGLDKLLNGDVVVLGLNFSRPKGDKNTLIKILNQYKNEEYNIKRMKGLCSIICMYMQLPIMHQDL